MRIITVCRNGDLWSGFPVNTYVQRLLARCQEMDIALAGSPVYEQWLYHPTRRTIYVWAPDLAGQSLSYLVVILAHELGHAVDFDTHPSHVALTRNLHWTETPFFIERAAFVNGFRILKELHVPISQQDYAAMIDDPMANEVVKEIEQRHLCCLLSNRNRRSSNRLSVASNETQLSSTA